MPTLYTTLNRIREHSPCSDGWRKLLKHLGKTEADDDPLPLVTILDSNGLDDALWCLRAVIDVEQHAPEMRLYAVWCARQVQHLLTDPRSLEVLDVAERHARGEATDDELEAARAERAERAAAWAAAGAERAATWDARAAAGAAAGNAAGAAAWAAAGAAGAARAAARAAAWAAAGAAGAVARNAVWAARAATCAAQTEEFKRRFCA
jgi:hypothetical protein